MDDAQMHRVCNLLIEFLETGTAPAGLFAPEVFCDFTPPLWRIQAQGLEDVVALRKRGHPSPGRVPRWNAQPTPQGFVMELEERWTDDSGEWYCREAIVAEVRGSSIARLSVYCTGDWDKSRQLAHAAQVKLIEP
ncbi:MAG: hypothetical protein U1E63_09380 [Burkholderiales bacterium]